METNGKPNISSSFTFFQVWWCREVAIRHFKKYGSLKIALNILWCKSQYTQFIIWYMSQVHEVKYSVCVNKQTKV